jgi:hypothetical protein
MVAAASDLGAGVCEDDATVSIDAISTRVDKVREWANRYGPELDWHIEDEDMRDAVEQALWLVPDVDALLGACRVQAEQIAALQEALKVARADVEKLMFEHRGSMLRMGGSYALSRIDVALALAEGCAAPAPEEEK